jgi:polysaccharide biosynthesis transport protein
VAKVRDSAAATTDESFIIRDYLSVIWRRKWTVLVTMLVVGAAFYGFSLLQSKVFEAQADLIYEQQLDVANPLTGQSYTDSTQRNVELSSVNAIIQSPTMQNRASTLLEKAEQPTTGYEVRAQVAEDVSGTGTQSSNVVSIFATSGDAEYSAAVAQAYADSFVSWRKERMLTQVTAAEDAVKAEIRDYPEAAKESSDYVILQQRLRDLQILRATATGNFRVLVPATVPSSPIEPKPVRSALIGLALGLIIGIALAFVLEQFDTRLRLPDDIAEMLHQPILARMPRLSREQMKADTLVTIAHPADRVSEAFRLMRSNLAFMDVDGKVKSIMVTSSLQGEGKSVTVANLAVTLALAGKKVVVIDADLRRPRQHRLFQLSNTAGASTVVAGEVDLRSALQPVHVSLGENRRPADFDSWLRDGDGSTMLWVLTSGPIPPNPGELVASQRFSQMVKGLRDSVDVVLVDSPAMLAVGDTAALAPEVDGLIFLVDMEQARRPVLQSAADQLFRLPCTMMGIAVRLSSGASGERYHYYARYSEDAERGGHQGARPSTPPTPSTATPDDSEVAPPPAVRPL